MEENKSLKDLNTFGIEVFAKYFTSIDSIEQAQILFSDHSFKNLNRLILGGGSNVLFTKNFDGLVIQNKIQGIKIIAETDTEVIIQAQAGVPWHELVMYTVNNNWGGIENLSLIPGCCGAAPMQNIGAYGVEFKDVFVSLEALSIENQKLKTFSYHECEFGYRESIFKHAAKNQYLISSIQIRLQKNPIFKTSYGAITETLEQNGIQDLSVKAISDAVIQIRSSKLPNPKELGNAGSFFKNPEISKTLYHQLIIEFPNIPSFPTSNPELVKVPAAWLIEQCGWKGNVVGHTGSHKNQALVLVNYGEATGNEIYKLALKIIDSVKSTFSIQLSPEVNII